MNGKHTRKIFSLFYNHWTDNRFHYKERKQTVNMEK